MAHSPTDLFSDPSTPWHGLRRTPVSALMTRDVVCVYPEAEFTDIVDILTGHRLRAVPVVDAQGNLHGVVTESDLMDAPGRAEPDGKPAQHHDRWHRLAPGSSRPGHTAARLMSVPPITIRPDAGIAEAARLMRRHGIGWLPVVAGAAQGEPELVGVLSRSDLLRGFERDDTDLRTEIMQVLVGRILALDPDRIDAQVHDGVVTLAGELDTREQARTLHALTEHLEGVVEVIDQLSWRHDEQSGYPTFGPLY